MGEVFAGRYELADPIGRGGVGAVWRAWDHRRRRYVAAKVLQQRDAHSLLRFVREQALRIDHPNVLAPASWAADDDKVLFTMDLVTGGSLVHLVGDYGPLPPAFVCTLLDQLLAGLAAVHAEGVVHRDIKPANVLLEATGTGRPKLRLSDFGIAMRLGEPRLTETNLVVGTPGYLAPEQMMGAEPDFPADLFAVGLVALYLLEGAKPDAKALVEYFAAHGTPSAPKGIPEPLWQVVAALLQPDPERRFRTATGARKALVAAAELLPEPGADDELIEIFDQVGPLPTGFGPDGPDKPGPGVAVVRTTGTADASRTDGARAHGGPDPRTAPPQPDRERERDEERPRETDGASARRTEAGEPFDDAEAPVDSDGDDQGSWDPIPSAPSPSTPSSSLPSAMSDTGSFHLPPPQATASTPQPGALHGHRAPAHHTGGTPHEAAVQVSQGPQVSPMPPPAPLVSPHDPTHVLPSSRSNPPEPSTAPYTARVPRTSQAPQPQRQVSRHRAERPRRPGPPAKVAVPLLLLALACYAVGFWALIRM